VGRALDLQRNPHAQQKQRRITKSRGHIKGINRKKLIMWGVSSGEKVEGTVAFHSIQKWRDWEFQHCPPRLCCAFL